MTFLESVLTRLESVDKRVRRAVEAVRGPAKPIEFVPDGKQVSAEHKRKLREAAAAAAAAPMVASAADEPPPPPLGDPTVALRIYGRVADPWTGRATMLLRDRDVQFEFVELDAPGRERLGVRLQSETQQQITPYVYIRGEFVGGFNALDEIERLGQLDEMLKTPEERARGGNNGVQIVIPRRGPEEAPPGER